MFTQTFREFLNKKDANPLATALGVNKLNGLDVVGRVYGEEPPAPIEPPSLPNRRRTFARTILPKATLGRRYLNPDRAHHIARAPHEFLPRKRSPGQISQP